MIYYFSGNGNTFHAALGLGQRLGYDVMSIDSECIDTDTLGICLPVWSWGVPPLALKWLGHVEIRRRPEYVWCVLTCGDETGDAPAMVRRALLRRGLSLDACFSIIMPNTYVLLPGFDVDTTEIADAKLAAVPQRLDTISAAIKERRSVTDITLGSLPRLKTRVVYPLFCKFGIKPTRWGVDRLCCVSCGECERSCPVGNIYMSNGYPVWGGNCTSCLGCYHSCPQHAVKYGSVTRSKGQFRYWFKYPEREI